MENSNEVIQQVPVEYITEHHITGEAREVNHFRLHLCGGCLYDKKLAIVSLNLQKQAWDEALGDILTAKVYSESDELLATNLVDGELVPTFQFRYYIGHGDLKIRVKNGAGSGMTYTLVVKFKKSNETAADPVCENRSAMNYIESRNNWMHRIAAAKAKENVYELVPIFRVIQPASVQTAQLMPLQLAYCFPEKQLKYRFTLMVLATDEKSSFATYACPHSVMDCTPNNAPFYDVSGAPANFVTVTLSGEKDSGPVTVIVRGDGRFKEQNNFLLATSMYSEV